MQVDLNGRKVIFTLIRGNLREQVAKTVGKSPEEITDSLVKYDPETNTVAVDVAASKNYAIYAAVHECICCGPYKSLAPKTSAPSKRCGLIDRMLIKIMPKSERENYIKKRIEMYQALIDYNLSPQLEKQFHEALKTVKAAAGNK